MAKRVPRRKSVTHKKYKWKKKGGALSKTIANEDPNVGTNESNATLEENLSNCHNSASVLDSDNFHDYTVNVSSARKVDHEAQPPVFEVDLSLLLDVKKKVDAFMPHRWFPIVHHNAVHVVFLSDQDNLAIQRCLVFLPCGNVNIFVHCQPVNIDSYLKNVVPPVPLNVHTVNEFVDRLVHIVNIVGELEACSGYDEERFSAGWLSCPSGEVDRNPYQECRYSETFRSLKCLRIVSRRKWRCSECLKLYGPLKRRALAVTAGEPNPNTANVHLTEEQKLQKLGCQSRKLNNANRKIKHLQQKVQELLKKDGVNIDENLSSDLIGILSSNKLTPAQSVFLQQQIKASSQKNMCGMRWHPTIIRMALSLHITSPSAYEMLRSTGMIKLPSSRTLFDYQQVKPPEEGLDTETVESISTRIGKFTDNYKKYFVLMADEMHISQNLIFQKSNMKMIGYTSLDEVDKEVKAMEAYLDKGDGDVEPSVATKVLTYMIKGVANGIKGVVATFGVTNVSVNQMYVWTWKVVGALERSDIRIVAFVCDGFSVNRAFIKMHEPVVCPKSGVLIGTVNKAARDRVLYFLSDVPHLLKTVRNCFLNSRSDGKRSRRKMRYRGKRISWDFIIRLYESKKSKCLRKSYKLNSMNVFPDSYARMKVKYAAQVLSKTVAEDLEQQNWDGTAETVNFIRKVNNWFDCLNGAHSSVAQKKRNENLNAYRLENDSRFTDLEEFLNYLEDWKNEKQSEIDSTAASDVLDTAGNDSIIGADEEGMGSFEENTPASKRILAQQTLDGVHMTTRAFIPLVQFLLREGTLFINARVFTQDPLEQHFSRVRGGQGGSNNPNLGQVLRRNHAIHVIGELGIAKKRGNCGEVDRIVEVTTEPLPKRKCERIPSIRS